jgi:hypothetical protein
MAAKTKKNIKESIKGTITNHRENVAIPYRLVKSSLTTARQQAQEPSPESYEDLLAKWGLTQDEVPKARTQLRLRVGLFGLTALGLAVLLGAQGLLWLMVLLLPPCLLGILTGLWRLHLLSAKRFVKFASWLKGG